MRFSNWVKGYHSQVVEAERLNNENKKNDSFFTVAPVNDKNRCGFIESFEITGSYISLRYKMKHLFDKTAIYLVRVVLAESFTNYIFTMQP